MIRRSAAALLLCATLAACATPTRFAPASAPGGAGWSEQRLENDRWRVAFTTGDGASPNQALDYALLRAAEITLAQGARWFTVIDRTGGPVAPRGPAFSFGLGGGSFGRGGGGFGSLATGSNGSPGFSTSLEILLTRGDVRPSQEAYDARELNARLRAAMPLR